MKYIIYSGTSSAATYDNFVTALSAMESYINAVKINTDPQNEDDPLSGYYRALSFGYLDVTMFVTKFGNSYKDNDGGAVMLPDIARQLAEYIGPLNDIALGTYFIQANIQHVTSGTTPHNPTTYSLVIDPPLTEIMSDWIKLQCGDMTSGEFCLLYGDSADSDDSGDSGGSGDSGEETNS